MYLMWFLQGSLLVSQNSINQLAFGVEMLVSCDVGTRFLNSDVHALRGEMGCLNFTQLYCTNTFVAI
jgi:hypothetical protein